MRGRAVGLLAVVVALASNGTGGYVSLTKVASTAERFAGLGGRVAVIDRELLAQEVDLQDISTQELAAQAGVTSGLSQYFAAIHNEVLAYPYINPEAVTQVYKVGFNPQ